MNGSSYVAEDPWANGWDNNSEPASTSRTLHLAPDSPPLPLALLLPMALTPPIVLPPGLPQSLPLALPPLSHSIHNLALDINPSIGSDDLQNVPQSYLRLYAASLSVLAESGLDAFFNHLDTLVFSSTQRAQISDTALLAGWSDFAVKSNCLNVFALMALEWELTGDGSLHVLSFRKKSLPEIPAFIVNTFAANNVTSHNSSLTENTIAAGMPPSFAYDWDSSDPHPTTSVSKADPLSISKADPMDQHALKAYLIELRSGFVPVVGSNDTIRIREVPEKEGLVFKHINYIITHDLRISPNGPAGTKKVVRRYSDFSWYVSFFPSVSNRVSIPTLYSY